MSQFHFWKPGIILTLLLINLFIADLLFGSVSISITDLYVALFQNTDSNASEIIWHFRLPKALTCLLAGSALSAAGLQMQTLFRNPLAGPDVLGLSSGASLMVALMIFLGQAGITLLHIISDNPWSLAIAASFGGAIVFLLVIVLAQYIKDNTALLIIGLMISAATSSIVAVLQYISRAEDLQTFMIWSLGNVGGTSWREIQVMLFVVLLGFIISISQMKSLNGWLLGENYSKSLGINIQRSRLWIVASTALLTGSVTAFCGPIAFVGLAVPHLMRLYIRTANHKIQLPFVMIAGASLLLICDLISQIPGNGQLLPLNAVTSMIGAPLVIWMVIRNKKVSI